MNGTAVRWPGLDQQRVVTNLKLSLRRDRCRDKQIHVLALQLLLRHVCDSFCLLNCLLVNNRCNVGRQLQVVQSHTAVGIRNDIAVMSIVFFVCI